MDHKKCRALKHYFPKNIFLVLLFLVGSIAGINAQRFAYVDTDYILGELPEYKSAQKKLDQYSSDWKKEIDKRVKEIDQLYQKYQAEKALMPEQEKKELEQKITNKEEALKQYKQQKFGEEGELYQKRRELVQPIQDRVFDAVQRLAKEESLDFIFDKSGAVTMLYTNAKYDRSDEVLKMLGIDLESESKEKENQND